MTVTPDAAPKPHARVLLIADPSARAPSLPAGLAAIGVELAVLEPGGNVADAARDMSPDVLVIAAETLSDAIVECVRAIRRDQPRAGVVLVGGGSGDLVEAVMARLREVPALRAENERLRRALEARKLVERAKGIVMRQRQLSEEDAYRALRRLAMEQNQPLADVARQVIALAAVLSP